MPLSHAVTGAARRRLAFALSLVATAACGDITFGGPCPDEERSVIAAGDIVDIRGRRLGAVHAVVGERRDSSRASNDAFFAVDLMGPDTAAGPLRGHVAALRLLGPGDTLIAAPALEQFPAGSAGSFLVRTVLLRFDDTTSVAPLRQLMLEDRLRVELTTDEQPARTFPVLLRRTSSKDWAHLMCL